MTERADAYCLQKQSVTVDECNDTRPERRSGRQRETVKPDKTSFSDHQNPTASMESGKVLLKHCSFGNPEQAEPTHEPAMLVAMQSGPNKNPS